MNNTIVKVTDKALTTIVNGLERRHAGKQGVAETLMRLNEQNCTQENKSLSPSKRDPACRHIATCLTTLWQVDQNLCAALGDLARLLHWQRLPDSVVRPPGKFMDDYAFATIIGPNGVYRGDDFAMGLFVLGPNQFYPDHVQAAPQFYWLFSGPSEWRISVSDSWTQKRAGDVLWNETLDSQAIRTGRFPLFGLWVRIKDIDGELRFLGAPA